MRKYLKKLSHSLHDDSDVFTELMLAWIAVALTILAVGVFLDILFA
jgi:hypothetical protein